MINIKNRTEDLVHQLSPIITAENRDNIECEIIKTIIDEIYHEITPKNIKDVKSYLMQIFELGKNSVKSK